ncbi:GIY-YIG nuclease family protein [Caulobacter sp. 17J80-11]|uniref:GIY-YIG nuclease family protein n=1 Tax=Caulobacter sp. 17J80-11 TaxID=2763502 RepID=UPI001653918A|nr:GIY-YIG nuclease family protein [Caulobacter sp. 17J80-11]MBC6981540.1 GIY-YIG nuclease family protein [Caulobacter sp. 17J80-11]
MDQRAEKAVVAGDDRAQAYGVYAVICCDTGEVWIGRGGDLDLQQTDLWRALSQGGSAYCDLQAAWDEHGADAFRFEELERLRDDFPAQTRDGELKLRQTIWLARLHAQPLGVHPRGCALA